MKWRRIASAPVHKSIILCTRYAGDASPHSFTAGGYLDWDGVSWRWDSDEPLEPKFEKPTWWMHFPDPPPFGKTEDQ